MNQKIKLTLAVLSVLVLVVGGTMPVWAQNNGADETETTLIVQQNNGQLTEEQLKQLEERLKKRKETLKLRLTNVEKTRLENRCKATQGALSSLQGRSKVAQTSREQVYSNLIQRLSNLEERLADSGLDTTDFKESIAELEQKIAEFNTALTDYIQAVTDLAIMRCSEDAEGFKASLERARQLHGELRSRAIAIKTLVKEKIKPTLVEIRAQLADKSESDGDGGDE